MFKHPLNIPEGMARIRTIKPEFFRHEELYEAEKKTGLPLRVAFAGMFTVADREGRFKWKPRQIKVEVLPYDDIDFAEVMDSLAECKFLLQYIVDGEAYGVIPSFNKHQFINNKEAPSDLPEPPKKKPRVKHAKVTREDRDPEGKERKGREGSGTDARAKVEFIPNEEPKIEMTIPASGITKQEIKPYVNESLESKEAVFECLKNNEIFIEESLLAMSQRGWRAATGIDIVALIQVFVNGKAKLEQHPDEIKRHFKNWILREKMESLTSFAENFKRQLV